MTFPVVVVIIGAVLLLVGLLRKLSSERIDFELTSGPRAAAIATGATLIVIAGIAFYAGAIATSPQISPSATVGPVGAVLQQVFPGSSTRPDALLAIIREQQRAYVRESWGKESGQCFTDDDLAEFRRSGIPSVIVQSLRHNNRFINVIRNVKAMEPAGRQELLLAAANVARSTWAQLGKITSKGQTEAGRHAELMIAEAVSNFANELLLQPDAELMKMYR
jgi:hypothetical protein